MNIYPTLIEPSDLDPMGWTSNLLIFENVILQFLNMLFSRLLYDVAY
jgi:hypothetical protein